MHLMCKETLREVGLLSLEKRRLMVGISSVCAKRGHRGDRVKLFSVLSIERKRGNRHKLKHRKFHYENSGNRHFNYKGDPTLDKVVW